MREQKLNKKRQTFFTRCLWGKPVSDVSLRDALEMSCIKKRQCKRFPCTTLTKNYRGGGWCNNWFFFVCLFVFPWDFPIKAFLLCLNAGHDICLTSLPSNGKHSQLYTDVEIFVVYSINNIYKVKRQQKWPLRISSGRGMRRLLASLPHPANNSTNPETPCLWSGKEKNKNAGETETIDCLHFPSGAMSL